MGLTENQINAVQTLADNKKPKQANAEVMRMIVQNSATPSLPSASLAKIFVKAAEELVKKELGYTGYINDKKQEEIERKASKLGLLAAQEAQRTGNVADGFRLMGVETAPKDSDATEDTTEDTVTTDSSIAAIKKDLGM